MTPTRPSLARHGSAPSAPPRPQRQSRALAGAPGVVVAGVLVAALVVPAGALVAVVTAVVAGVVVTAGAWNLGPRLLRRAVGATSVGPGEQARVRNLTGGLCAAMGVAVPSVFVVVDPVPNAMVLGTARRHASLVVTSGLEGQLSRMELEGVVAHELAHLKAGDQVAGTVAGVVLGPLAALSPAWRRALARSAVLREARADLAGVSATRYPPGLRSALERLRDGPAPSVRGRRGWLAAHLWINPPRQTGDELQRRIEALDEL